MLIEVLMIMTYERCKGTVICKAGYRGKGTCGGALNFFAYCYWAIRFFANIGKKIDGISKFLNKFLPCMF